MCQNVFLINYFSEVMNAFSSYKKNLVKKLLKALNNSVQ